MLIKTNNIYGGQVGGHTVFTREGAVEVYKTFVETVYSNFSTESALAIGKVEEEMIDLGFTWEELEQIELSAVA